jgi:TPR repeat protein
MYESGRGVTKDAARAFGWFRKAAELGNPNAQVNLALMYETGRGVGQNIGEARRWLGKAAAQHFVPAEALLARLGQAWPGS